MTSLPQPGRLPVRVLIVDDSAVMRSLLRNVVGSDNRFEVAGTASDGSAALQILDSLRPDLILLDVEMPVMDGLSTLRRMRSEGIHTPVIMCSTATQRGARVTIEALANGAADYVAKPSGQTSREAAIQALTADLIPRILALRLAAPGLASLSPARSTRAETATPASTRTLTAASAPIPTALLIAVSTGGPAALDTILPALPASFPLPILIVQHMPELFTALLAERLDGRCALHVREAAAGLPARPGGVFIARGNWHMEVVATPTPIIRLNQDPPENHCRPAADVLFRSAAAVYGTGAVALVLTGMGSDGLAGSRLIRQHGGIVLAQDQATSAVWGMPAAVIQAGLANAVLPLNAIAPEILRIAARAQHETASEPLPAFRETAV